MLKPNQRLARVRLTMKERQFVQALVLCRFNAAAAARKIGYAESWANVMACRMMARPTVLAEVERLRAELLADADARVDELLRDTRCIATSNICEMVEGEGDDFRIKPLSALSEDQQRAIAQIRIDATGGTGDGERRRVLRTTIKLHPKVPALELLMKVKGMIIERRHEEHTLHVMIADELRAGLQRAEQDAVTVEVVPSQR